MTRFADQFIPPLESHPALRECGDDQCKHHGIRHGHAEGFTVMLPDDNGWSDWTMPVMQGYKFKCCGCELEHEIEFNVCDHEGKQRVEWRLRRAKS